MEAEIFEITREKIRIELLTQKHFPDIEIFIREHFLQDLCLYRALDQFRNDGENITCQIHWRNVARNFAQGAISANPQVSLVAVNSRDEIIGMRLSEINSIDSTTGKFKIGFDHGCVILWHSGIVFSARFYHCLELAN